MDVAKKEKKKIFKYIADDRHKRLAKYIDEKRIDLNAIINRRGEKMVHLAAKEGAGDCLEYLVEKGAKVNLVDKKGNLALHHAIQYCIQHYSRNNERSLVSTLLTYCSTPQLLNKQNIDGVSAQDLLNRLNQVKNPGECSSPGAGGGDGETGGDDSSNDRDSDAFEYSDKKWREKLEYECDYELEQNLGRFERDFVADYGTGEESYADWADRIYRAYSSRQRRTYSRVGGVTEPPANSAGGEGKSKKRLKSLKPEIDLEQSRRNLEELRQKRERKQLSEKCAKLFSSGGGKEEEPIVPQDIPFSGMEPAHIIDAMLRDVIDLGKDEIKKKIREEIRRWHPDKFSQKFKHRINASCYSEVMERVKHVAQALTQYGK